MACGDERARKKLVKFCGKKITEVFDGSLSYIEMFLDDAQYAKVRSKILRIGNNAIRSITTEINDHYGVDYDSRMDTVVKVKEGNNEEKAGN